MTEGLDVQRLLHATSILKIDYSVPFETTKTNLLRSQSIIFSPSTCVGLSLALAPFDFRQIERDANQEAEISRIHSLFK